MKIEKTFTVRAPRERVWEFITAPAEVAPCIPGCDGAQETAPGRYRATIRTSFGPVRASFAVAIERTEERPPEYAAYMTSGEEDSRASRLKASSALSLVALEENLTQVTYRSDINIMGRLGKFGAGMMQKVADGIGEEFVSAMRARLEGAEPASAGAVPVRGRRYRAWVLLAVAALLCAALVILL